MKDIVTFQQKAMNIVFSWYTRSQMPMALSELSVEEETPINKILLMTLGAYSPVFLFLFLLCFFY